MSVDNRIRKLQKELRDLDIRRSKSEVLLELSSALFQAGRESEGKAVRERWKDENGY